MNYEYKMGQMVCSDKVTFQVNDGIVTNVVFYAGCNGNSKGVAALCEGMQIDEIIRRLENVTCGMKPTSCPAQFAKALAEIRSK